MPKVFVSYVRDDSERINRLVSDLRANSIEVWRDRDDILPGHRWESAIRSGIQSGDFFLACFSSAYNQRESTYMNTELVLAIEELRKRPHDSAWFIPIKIDACEIPERPIGGGDTLRSIQFVDLSEDWEGGVQRILSVVQPSLSTPKDPQETTGLLASMTMHEMRGSLYHVKARLDKMRRSELDPEIADELNDVFRQFEDALQLTRLFGAMRRVSDSTIGLRRTRISDIQQLVIEVARPLKSELRRKNQLLRFEIAKNSNIPLYADRDLLELVFRNLLENAVKYSKVDDGRGRMIIVQGYVEDESHCFRVSSWGMPIPVEERDRVFEAGFRGTFARRGTVVGTGLGLFIASRIVAAHGGNLKLEPNPDPRLVSMWFSIPFVHIGGEEVNLS